MEGEIKVSRLSLVMNSSVRLLFQGGGRRRPAGVSIQRALRVAPPPLRMSSTKKESGDNEIYIKEKSHPLSYRDVSVPPGILVGGI